MPGAEPMNVMAEIFSSPCKYAALAKKSRKSGKKVGGGRKTKSKRGKKVTKKTRTRRGRKGKRSRRTRHGRRRHRGGAAAINIPHDETAAEVVTDIGADIADVFAKRTGPMPHHPAKHTSSQPKRIPRK